MKTRRGDVVLVLFPNSDLRTARRRPALVLQRDNLGSGLEQTIVAMIEQQPVPGIMRDRSTPAATSSSSSIARSSIDSEFASLLVPKTASPQFCDSNHLQCAMKRWLSGARSALNGVTTGANTPRMRSLAARPSIATLSTLPNSSFILLPFRAPARREFFQSSFLPKRAINA